MIQAFDSTPDRTFPAFLIWLRRQYNRQDEVGGFAQRLRDDIELARLAGEPVRLTTFSGMDRRLRDEIGIDEEMWATRERAGREFNTITA
jgi:hypothetical protein